MNMMTIPAQVAVNHALLTNPVVLQRTVDEGGVNLLRGMAALAANLKQLARVRVQ